MKPVVGILGWILLGAVSTGLGTGIFLYKANMDRAALLAQAAETKAKAEGALENAQRIAEEANTKIDQASKDIAAAQARVAALEEERVLMSKAGILTMSAASRRWPEFLNIGMGIGFRLPTNAREYENSPGMFLAGPRTRTSSTEPWIEIHGYSKPFELAWTDRLLEPSTVSYLVNGRLITGMKGRLPDSTGSAYVLRVQQAASGSHMIWARTGTGLSDAALLDVLASLTFAP